MKKFIISALAMLFVFTAVNAQSSDSSMHKGKSKMEKHGTKKKMSHASKTKPNKTKTKAVSAVQQNNGSAPVAQTTPATKTRTSAKTASNKSLAAKGNNYAVNSNGKKTYLKTHS